jgi:RNA polymerase sigma factor (sigma-70 family)
MRSSGKATTKVAGVVNDLDDADLVARAAGGDQGAFEELYRRHAPAAQRVAHSVTGNPDDAADAVSEAFTRLFVNLPAGSSAPLAFRPYLMAATRNAAIDQVRRRKRVEPTDVIDLDREAAGAGPSDRIVMGEDSDLVVQAFRDLPERWRSVLWLMEIEGVPPREAAERLGLSPNGASQLAVRARAGLRERYLQAHLRMSDRKECQFTLERLGAYVGGGLAPRDVAKVDQHLAGCESCQQARDELEELAPALRRSLIPIPLIFAGVAAGRWAQVTLASSTSGLAGAGAGAAGAARRVGQTSMATAQKALAVATAGLFAAGVIGAATVDGNGGNGAPKATTVAQPPALPSPDEPPEVVVLSDAASRRPVRVARRARFGRGDTVPASAELARGADDAPPAPPSGPEPPAPPPPPPTPVAQVSGGGRLGPLAGGAGAGLGDGECTGVGIGPAATGCSPAAPAGDGVVVSTGGQALPAQTVGLP